MSMIPLLSLLSDILFLRLHLRTQAFKFSAPKSTTFEVAIINVKGSTMDPGNMTEEALRKFRQVQDANRHRLVHSVYRHMQIPEAVHYMPRGSVWLSSRFAITQHSLFHLPLPAAGLASHLLI